MLYMHVDIAKNSNDTINSQPMRYHSCGLYRESHSSLFVQLYRYRVSLQLWKNNRSTELHPSLVSALISCPGSSYLDHNVKCGTSEIVLE